MHGDSFHLHLRIKQYKAQWILVCLGRGCLSVDFTLMQETAII